MSNGNDDDILLEGMTGFAEEPVLGGGVYRGELDLTGELDTSPAEMFEDVDVVGSIRDFEETYSKAATPVTYIEQEQINDQLREAIEMQLRSTRPGHEDDWYKERVEKRIHDLSFVHANYAPDPPELPSVSFLKNLYQQYPEQLRSTYRPDSSVGRVVSAISTDKTDEQIQELIDKTTVSEWPSEFTWGGGFVNAMQRGLSRRVIEVEAGADKPGSEMRWEHGRKVSREYEAIMDDQGWGAGVARMWANGPSMDENDAYRAGLFLDEDEATARELVVSTGLGMTFGAMVRSKLGYLLPRAGVWGRRTFGLRGAVKGATAGSSGGPIGMTIGAVIGGFVGYGAGKVWGKVDAEEFFKPVPAFPQDEDDDGWFFALPKGLVDLSTRTLVLTGLADSAVVPIMASSNEEADRMRDIIAMSRPSEAWESLVHEYRTARDSGRTSEELREELRPLMGGMVRNVAWADLPDAARHADNLDLETAIEYATANKDVGDINAPKFTFQYFVGLANEGNTGKKGLQRVLHSLPIGQILNHVPQIIVGDESRPGSIPSVDTFIDGVMVAARDTEEAYALTGTDTTRDLATGFAELMLERREVGGTTRYVENTPGKLFRVLSSVPELYMEMRLPFDIPLTPASRDARYNLGIRDPDVGYWANFFSNVETGEMGLARHVTDEMISRGVDRQSWQYRGIATGGVMADWLVYWERPIISGIGMPTRAGLRGYGAWKQYKDNPLRLQAVTAALSPRLYAFRNKVDVQNTQAWANVSRFLGEDTGLEGLQTLKGGKASDGSDVVLGVRESGIVDRMIEAMEQGKSFEDAEASLPTYRDHDWYTVQSHLLSEGVKNGVIKGDDVWAVVPKPMRSQVIQVMAAAGIEPSSAIRALNQYILKARKINLHAMEKLLTEGTPEMIAFRGSDQYKNLRNVLLEAVGSAGGATDHVNISMPKLELQAWIAALDPQRPNIKSMEDYFDALRIELEGAGGPPPTKGPKDPPVGGPEDPPVGGPGKDTFDDVGPTDSPRDLLPAPKSFEDQWEFIQVLESPNGGYWKRKGEGPAVTSPLSHPELAGGKGADAITVFRHSPVLGETPAAAGDWVGARIKPTGVWGDHFNPIMHASRGADHPALTLYSAIDGNTYKFTIAATSRASQSKIGDVPEMYRTLVAESLAEFKQHLDSNPDAEYVFIPQKSKMKIAYKPSGQIAFRDQGYPEKTFSFYKKWARDLGLEETTAWYYPEKGSYRETKAFRIPSKKLEKMQEQAALAAKDPSVIPPSAVLEHPKHWSKKKVDFIESWRKWAKESGMDPLISKVSETFMQILPNRAFEYHNLYFHPTSRHLYGSQASARGSGIDSGIPYAVKLYFTSKAIKYDPETSPLAKMTKEEIAEDARKSFQAWKDDKLAKRRKEKGLDPPGSDDYLAANSDLRAIEINEIIEVLGPHVAEISRRMSERRESGARVPVEDDPHWQIDTDHAKYWGVSNAGEWVENQVLQTGVAAKTTDVGYNPTLIRRAVRRASDAIAQSEYSLIKVAHTFVHEMTHVLHYSVLSEKELKALRRAYVRERDAGFPNWRRARDFKKDLKTESAFGEWLADTVSDYWITGNASRHGLFTKEEAGLLQSAIRRMAHWFKQLFGWRSQTIRGTAPLDTFPEEIIDLLERLTKQALEGEEAKAGWVDETVEIRPKSELRSWYSEDLGPVASTRRTGPPRRGNEIPRKDWDENWQDKPAIESARWLRDQVDNDLQKAVLDKVIESLDETGTDPRSTSVKTYLSDLPGLSGRYHPDRGWVLLDPARSSWQEGGMVQVAIHELVHAATVGKIEIYPDSIQVKRLDRLFDEARSQVFTPAHKTRSYGWNDRLEFIAEGLSNPKFQDELRSIKISDELASELGIADPNLWEGLVAIIRQLLGLGENDQSALSGLLKVTDDIARMDIEPKRSMSWMDRSKYEPPPPARMEEILDTILDEKSAQQAATANAPLWVRSIQEMPEERALDAAESIAANYAPVGSKEYEGIVSYIVTGGREGRLNRKILADFEPGTPASTPSTGPTPRWRVFYDTKVEGKDGTTKLVSSAEVWNSADADALYHIMKSGNIFMIFNNGGKLLRRFLGSRDYRHLVRELDTKGGRDRLSPDGERAAKKAFKAYIETGKASGPLLPLFDQLYLNLQSYWLRLSKDRSIIASPEIRGWFDEWLAPDLNLRPLAAEITERVLTRFKQVRIAEPEDLLKRLEEGMVGLMGRKEEFWRVPLDTPTVRNALGITDYTKEMDVVDAFSRAVGYVAGEHARIMSGAEKMFDLTTRSHVPASRVKAIHRDANRRVYQVLNGKVEHGTGTGKLEGKVVAVLSPAQAASFRVFLRSLSAEALGNILPIHLLDESTDLTQISLADMNTIMEVVIDIEAGVAASRTHYSERISPTLAVAMWNGLKQMSINSEKYSDLMKSVSGGIRSRFSEASDLEDLGPFQRQVVEMTTRELGGIPNEMLRWLIEFRKGNKDATLHEMYLAMKNQLEAPVKVELVEKIMGRPATPTDKGSKGWLVELERFHGSLEADPEGPPLAASRRRDALLGRVDDEVQYEDPTGGDIAGSFLDHVLENLSDLQSMMEQEKLSHPVYGRLAEEDHHSLQILQTYKDKLKKFREGQEKGAPRESLDKILSEEDFSAVEDALYYVLDRIRRQKDRISQRAVKIGRALSGDTDFADSIFMKSSDVQGEYYVMFYEGRWLEMFEAFGTRTGMATGFEKTRGKAPEIDPGTALVHMIATLRADEILEGLAGVMAKYGIAKDVRELTSNYSAARAIEGQYSGINRDLFHGRIQYYIDGILSFQMSAKRYPYAPMYTAKAGDTLESIAKSHGVTAKQLAMWNGLAVTDPLVAGQAIRTADHKMLLEQPRAPFTEKLAPVLPTRETRRAKERGAPEDFYGNVHDLEAYTQAVDIIHNWGFKTAKEGFELRTLPDGSRVFAPNSVWKHLDNALDRATGAGTARGVVAHRVDPAPLGVTDYKWSPDAERKMALGRAVDSLQNMFPSTFARIKMGVTTGIVLPNPAYFTGVFLGAGFQAMQGVGPVGFFKMMRNPKQTGAVIARLWKEGSFAPDAPPIVSKNGQIYTVEMLAQLAEAHGLKSSFIHAETMKAIASDIREFHPGFWNKMRVGRWAKNWQKTLIESATALDNYWRVSVFIHEIRMGKSPAAAAEKARLVGYDYAALTKWEKKFARNTIMFYSYMRKNMDLFWDTLLTNPERLIGQMRLLRGIHTVWLDDDPQIVLKDYLHGRLPTYFKETTINTHKYSQWMFISPPLPMMDALNIYIDIYDLIAFRDEEAMRGLATRSAPWVQAPFVMATGKDIFWDKELNEYNKIPSWLMEMDLALTGGGLMYGVFGAQRRPHSDLSRADISGESERGWYHARNGRAWWIWRNLLQFPGAGRSMDTISYMDRANLGAVEASVRTARWARRTGAESGWWSGVPEMGEGDTMGPRTGLAWKDELAGLFGFKPIHVPQRSHQTAVDSIRMHKRKKQVLARERLSEED